MDLANVLLGRLNIEAGNVWLMTGVMQNSTDVLVENATITNVPILDSAMAPALKAGAVVLMARLTAGIIILGVIKASSLDAQWTPLPLLAGWANGGSGFQVAQYRKVTDVVQIRGWIVNGTSTVGTVISTLPVGYRPPARQINAIVSNNGLGRIDVLNTGAITIDANIATWISLDGIQFSVNP